MPYADVKVQRAVQAEWYRQKYNAKGSKGKKFREEEAKRKADWLANSPNRDQRLKKMRDYTRKWRAAQKKAAAATKRKTASKKKVKSGGKAKAKKGKKR